MRRCALLAVVMAVTALGCTGAPDQALTDAAFLGKYGWTAADLLATHTVRLPDQLADEPGAFPTGFYWAYQNQLSRDIGLDFSHLAGQEVTARLYRLEEDLPDDNPGHELRAVVLRHEEKLAGAFLDRMGHFGLAGSLKGRTFAQVVNQDFGQWLEQAGVVDYDHPRYEQLTALSPAELIQAYWAAIAERRYQDAYAMLTLPARIHYLFANREPAALYNPDYGPWGLENMLSAGSPQLRGSLEVTDRIRATPELNRRVTAAVQFSATVDVTFQQVGGRDSGRNLYFITVVKEGRQAPWLLDAFASGP